MTFKILLICEDPQQANLYSDLISEMGDCTIDVLSRMATPVDWAMNGQHYHLVVMDSLGKEAFFLLDRIKRMSPQTSVILASDAQDPASIEEAVMAMRMGAEDFFGKPIQIDKFQMAVRRCLDQKTVFAEGSAQASGYMNLISSCQMISASMEKSRVFSIVMGYFSRQLKTSHIAIYAMEGGKPICLDHFIEEEEKRDHAMQEVLDIALHVSNPFPHMLESGEYYRFVEKSQLMPGLFVFRFAFGDQKENFCLCLSPQKLDSMDAFTDCLGILRSQIEVTGRNIENFQSAQKLAFVDDATGLFNTRYLHTVLDQEIAAFQATGRSFAVLFVDADHFKQVNDQHGHMIGTRLLNELGHHLKEQLRDSDSVIRYGGDEFVAILSPCDLNTAKAVAERIRQSVEIKDFINEDDVKVRFTVSIGVALFPLHANSKKAIIDAADTAMYKAKKGSRNSVVIGLE